MNTLAPALPTVCDVVDAPEETFHAIDAHLDEGFDGAVRVLTMLRTRRYDVRDVTVAVADGGAGCTVRCTVVLTAARADVLLERLRRMPAVTSAART